MRFPRPEFFAALLIVLLFVSSAEAIDRRDLGIYEMRDGDFHPTPVALAEDVLDPIFGFIIGVLERDLYGAIDVAYFDSLATAEGGSKMPYDAIRRMERWPGTHDADARVKITWEKVEFPIPYSILGYHPGTIRFSRVVEMLHWKMGDRSFSFDTEEDGEALQVDVREAHLFMVYNGTMEFDIDGWLDRMMGGKLDDVNMVGFFVFRDGDDQIGLGFGYNNDERGRTGAFDFTLNESLFPAKKAYLALGREMRALAESRLDAWRLARGGGWPRGMTAETDR